MTDEASFQVTSADRRRLLKALAGGAALATLPGEAHAAGSAAAPNILFILADDLGWADVGCYGRNDVRTPVLDRLAAEGMKFDHAYANSSVCSPTRVALITGRYQNRLEVGQDEPLGVNPNLGLEPGLTTIPGLLRKASYQTSLVGKWHLGLTAKVQPPEARL